MKSSLILQKLAILLYYAADECGYVDPRQVEDVLKVPQNKDITTTPIPNSDSSSQAAEGKSLFPTCECDYDCNFFS